MEPPESVGKLQQPETDRFVVRRRLGKGGMGVVYEAFDQARSLRVALKTLNRIDPASLYRFKREFRLLANVSHPNLVSLYELVAVKDRWFFTMEFIQGVDFLSYVRGADPGVDAAPGSVTETATGKRRTHDSAATQETLELASTPPEDASGAEPVDVNRLRPALAQLAEGVHALHETGHLHRDIKPSNVLVTAAGRVVLLDFGVISELAGERWQTEVAEIVGTPAYMAPEIAQVQAKPGPAADWYSVGVVLYEALTGRRPLRGAAGKVLAQKLIFTPAPPKAHRADLPDDLCDLCMDLLRANPEERPDGREVLSRLGLGLGSQAPKAASVGSSSQPIEEEMFVGREEHLEQLRAAFAETQQGNGVTLYLHGSSGVGKSELVRQFLNEVSSDTQVVVLAGRCYERESVPYKAVDSLVDSLARYLLAVPRHEADAILPRDILLLARVFPVLQRVEAVVKARRRSATPDPHELKRRAFAALRELLTRLAEYRPLVLFIDDLQWGDADSVPFLADLMRPPDAPPLLLIATYRSEDADSPILRALSRRDARLGPAATSRRIEVAAMPPAEALELASVLLRRSDTCAGAAEIIVRESRGNPFFIHELARHVQAEGGTEDPQGGPVSLEAVIRARVNRLSTAGRHLLEIIAVAGKPLSRDIIERAAEIEDVDRSPLVELQAAHLVRMSGSRRADLVETYHDRIRATVVANLPEDAQRAHHLRLAYAIQVSERPDAESLADHFRAAGKTGRAAEYATLAARQASDALAFDRASQFYRTAIDLGVASGEEARALKTSLAQALANAGRGPESAAAYLEALPGASEAEALELQQSAALQYVKAGHMDRGLALLRKVLSKAGFHLARTPRRALLWLVYRRARLRLRGLRFRPRDTSEIPPKKIARIDLCWSAGVALAMMDTFRGADFQTRHMLLALRAGDTYRVARALCFEVGFAALPGTKGRGRVLKLLARARAYAQELGRPELVAFVSTTAALFEYLIGNFREAEKWARRGIELFCDQCTGVQYERDSAELYLLWALHYAGELEEMSERLQRLLKEAEEKGNLYAATSFRTGPQHIAWLMGDDPDAAYEDARTAERSRAGEGFHLQNYWTTYALTQCDLYAGAAPAAHARIREAWDHLRKVLVFRIQFCGIEAQHLRGRCALAVATTAADPEPFRREAERCARHIARKNVPWSSSLAKLLRAGLAHLAGNDARAVALLEAAEQECVASDMALHAAVCRRCHGLLLGGDEGTDLVSAADAWLSGQGAANPGRMAALFAPGFEHLG